MQEKLTKETRRLKSENANLASQLKHSEHRVKVRVAVRGAYGSMLPAVETVHRRRFQEVHHLSLRATTKQSPEFAEVTIVCHVL